jgi:hypothetical protein
MPENWFTDDWNFPKSRGRKIRQALVEECYCLNQAIAKNQIDIEKNANEIQAAFDFVCITIVVFGAILIPYSIWRLLDFGS